MKCAWRDKDSLLSHYVFVKETNKIDSCSTTTHCDLHLVRPKANWATKYNEGFSGHRLRNKTDDFEVV